jgi:UDP:flavonoid glycosyltransferase YjiC (YdhE family)
MLAIATALQARGERVCIATHGGPYTRVLDDAGVPYTLLTPVMDAARCSEYVQGIVTLGKPGARLQSAEEVHESVRSEVAFLQECGATMAVIGFTLSLYLSSRMVGIPLATSHGGSFVPPVFERGLAPTPTQAPMPGADWLPGFLLRFMANNGPPRMQQPVAFLNEVADELGVEPVPSLAALMLGDLTLVTDVPDVLGIPADILDAWRPSGRAGYRAKTRLRYTGPLHAQLQVPVPTAVQSFLDRARPTAYVALNSSTPAFIRRVVAGVRAAGLRLIVSATVHELASFAGDDVVVGGVLPSHLIMPHMDLAVIMGGQGSVQTAMCSGTPFIAFPLQPEQELNVGIGVRHGMALGIGPRHMTEERVAAAARRMMGDSSFRVAAQRVQALYAGVDGPANAAEAIVDYLSNDGAR